MRPTLDPAFLALPLRRLADAALSTAAGLGATQCDVRIERIRTQTLVVRDRELQTADDSETVGLSVRVIHKGAWGFAAAVDLTAETAMSVAARPLDEAGTQARLNTETVLLADETP